MAEADPELTAMIRRLGRLPAPERAQVLDILGASACESLEALLLDDEEARLTPPLRRLFASCSATEPPARLTPRGAEALRRAAAALSPQPTLDDAIARIGAKRGLGRRRR